MLINQLARRSGVSTRALRHYDRLGLLSSRRLDNGYRDFAEPAVEEVRRIRLLLEIGLGLQTVAQVLPCFDADGSLTDCPTALESLRTQIREVDRSIARLERTRGRLTVTLDNLSAG